MHDAAAIAYASARTACKARDLDDDPQESARQLPRGAPSIALEVDAHTSEDDAAQRRAYMKSYPHEAT